VRERVAVRPLDIRLHVAYCRQLNCYIFSRDGQLQAMAASGLDRLQVDFAREFVAVVCRGECRTGGYAVRVKQALVREKTLLLEVELIDPAPEAAVTLAMTYPQAAVAVPRAAFGGLPERVILRETGSGRELLAVAL